MLLLVNSALHPSGVAKSSTSFGLCKGWNVTSAGWQVTLGDPIWHLSSSSGVPTSVSELLSVLLYFTFSGSLSNVYNFILSCIVFLWPPCVADADIIFLPCGFFLLSSFFLA